MENRTAPRMDPASAEALEALVDALEHNAIRERIACSAIWFQDGKNHAHQPTNIELGFVVYGLGHHHIFATLAAVEARDGIKNIDSEQGFLTTWNRFVSREEAAGVAWACGQVETMPKQLFSEDVFYKREVAKPDVMKGAEVEKMLREMIDSPYTLVESSIEAEENARNVANKFGLKLKTNEE